MRPPQEGVHTVSSVRWRDGLEDCVEDIERDIADGPTDFGRSWILLQMWALWERFRWKTSRFFGFLYWRQCLSRVTNTCRLTRFNIVSNELSEVSVRLFTVSKNSMTYPSSDIVECANFQSVHRGQRVLMPLALRKGDSPAPAPC